MPAEIIRLRLARHGFRNNPFYHIVAIANHKPRDALPLEKLGEYDPIPRYKNNADLPTASKVFGANPGIGPKSKRIEWNVERINWWLKNGAQPTGTVVKLLERGGVLKVPHPWQNQYSPGVENGKAYDEESIGLSSWHDRRKAGRGPVDTPAGRMTGHAGVTAT